MDNNIKIRTARPGDEGQLARVHIQSWQEAYKGIVPEEFLKQLPAERDQRIENWKKTLVSSKRWVWVAEGPLGIVGFILFGIPRDDNRYDYIELGAIYLLAAENGNGIGFSLLRVGFEKMKELGYSKAYCWVLENNPTIKFYESTGAHFSAEVKQDEIGGKNFFELAYEWSDLNLKAPISQRNNLKKSRSIDEFWGLFLQITFHEGKPERWITREKKAKWCMDHLKLKIESTVLDLGCGDGVIDIWLSRFGCDVTAVDKTGVVLNHARLEDDTKKVNFIQCDLQKAEFANESFDGIFIFETLGLLKKEQDLKLLEQAYKWLKKGGQIAVDCPIYPSKKNVWKKEFSFGTVSAETSFDEHARIHKLNFEFFPKVGRPFILRDSAASNYCSESGISRYIYAQEELYKILEEIGFKVKVVPHYYDQGYFGIVGVKD